LRKACFEPVLGLLPVPTTALVGSSTCRDDNGERGIDGKVERYMHALVGLLGELLSPAGVVALRADRRVPRCRGWSPTRAGCWTSCLTMAPTRRRSPNSVSR
jgi:hypothetical protein